MRAPHLPTFTLRIVSIASAPVKSQSNISPDAWINYANKHENKVVLHCFKSQGFRQMRVVGEGGGAGVLGELFSRKPSDARTMRRRRKRGREGRREGGRKRDEGKNAEDPFSFSRSHQGQRRRNPDSFFFVMSLGSPSELQGGLVQIVDGGKIAESWQCNNRHYQMTADRRAKPIRLSGWN